MFGLGLDQVVIVNLSNVKWQKVIKINQSLLLVIGNLAKTVSGRFPREI